MCCACDVLRDGVCSVLVCVCVLVWVFRLIVLGCGVVGLLFDVGCFLCVVCCCLCFTVWCCLVCFV